MPEQNILLAEDDSALCMFIQALLKLRGWTCDVVRDGDACVERLRRNRYCAVVLDLMLPGRNGFDVLQFIRAEQPSLLPRVIVMTAASPATLRDFNDTMVGAFLRKPFEIDEFLQSLDRCCGESSAAPGPSSHRVAM